MQITDQDGGEIWKLNIYKGGILIRAIMQKLGMNSLRTVGAGNSNDVRHCKIPYHAGKTPVRLKEV